MSMVETQSMNLEARIRPLKEEAVRRGCQGLLENFAPNVLLCVMEEQGQNAALGKTLNALQRCVKAREVLHALEREMDKEYFVQLVTGGYLERSGVDRETQSVVTWLRSGDFFKSTWRIPLDSPKAKALVRAFIWLHETKHVQNDFQPSSRTATYYSCSMGLMEFNPAMMKAVVTVIKDLFPISNQGVAYTFGLHKAVPVLWNIILRVYPQGSSRMRLFDSFSNAVDMVTDATDIPDFWFSDEYDATKYRFKRTNTWCFERCLSDENKVTTKDLYNPGPWPYAADESVDVNSSALSIKREAKVDAKGNSRDTKCIDGLHGWFGRGKGSYAPISSLALDAIEEDDTAREDM